MTATRPNASLVASAHDVSEQVKEAVACRQGLRILGGGSWVDANRPVRAATTLAIGPGEIVEYEPGDLTLTARAGVTLDAIARATAPQGQWLALDPPGDPTRATIGATIATASYGPLAHQFGTPRDLTLGVEFVTGTGRIARGGGRVVKNVAGFDMTRLLTGSWGSLGVITEVTVRLRALPAVEATLALDVGPVADRIDSICRALRAFPFKPLAAHWIGSRLTRRLAIDSSGAVVLVRVGGNPEAIRAQRSALESLGPSQEIGAEVWNRLRVVEPATTASFRLSRRPSEFAATWSEAQALVDPWPDGYCHGDAGRGVVRCVLPLGAAHGVDRLRALTAMAFAGTRIFERLPGEAWASVPSSIGTRLEHRIKAAFDPNDILNPGIFGEMR